MGMKWEFPLFPLRSHFLIVDLQGLITLKVGIPTFRVGGGEKYFTKISCAGGRNPYLHGPLTGDRVAQRRDRQRFWKKYLRGGEDRVK